METVADLLLALVCSVGLVIVLHRFHPELGWSRITGWFALAFVCLVPVVGTPMTQLPLDYAASFAPWAGGQPENPLLTDVVLVLLPLRHLVRERMLAGEFPWWTHAIGTGAPLMANAQAAVGSPLHWITIPVPPIRAMSIVVLLQMGLCLTWTDALARSFGAAPSSSPLAAVATTFSTFAVVWAYYPHGLAFAIAPGFLLAVGNLAEGKPRAVPLAVATGYLLGSAGQPQIALFVGLAALPLWSYRLSRAPVPTRWRNILGTAIAASFTVAALAPILVPTIAYLPFSERALLVATNPSALNPVEPSFELWSFLADPLGAGSPRDGNWRGPWNFNEVASGWAGGLTLVLALAGTLAGPRAKASRWLLAGGFAALAVALRVPFFDEMARSLPLLESATTGRLRLIWVLVISVGAAVTLEHVPSHRWCRAWVIFLAFCLATGLLLRTSPDIPRPQFVWRCATAGGLLGFGLLLAIPRMRPLAQRLVVPLVAIDLGTIAFRYWPLVPEGTLDPPAVIEELRQASARAPGHGRTAALGGRLLPTVPVLFGLSDPRGFDPLRPAEMQQFLRGRLHRPAQLGYMLIRRPLSDPSILDFLGIRGLLAAPSEIPDGWIAGKGGPLTVHLNPRARGLFHGVRAVDVVPTRQEALERAAEAPDLSALILFDGEDSACAGLGLTAPDAPLTSLDLSTTSNGFSLAIDADYPAALGSSVTWLPGWHAESSAGPVRLCRSWGLFLGLILPAGHSDVRLSYRPPGLSLGLATALGGLAIGILLLRLRIPE